MSDSSRSLASRLGAVLLVAAVVAAFLLGFWMRGGSGPAPGDSPSAEAHDHEAAEAEVWTCSMHPQIRLPEPGQCPVCFMDLIPVEGAAGAGDETEREMVFSEAARRLAEIRTAPVERRFPTVEVRLVGKVDYDETRLRDIAAYVPGRLDRLYVDYTGVPVRRGDHLVDLYSPELLAAQEELIQALRARESLRQSSLEIMRRTAEATVKAAREKLRLWGLLPEQIAALEESGLTSEHVTIYSPLSGVVIEKHAQQGRYVETGTPIYTIADLDRLWVRFEAYESDMEWVHLGQEVEFTAEAYPGRVFRGRISFVDPVLSPRTRTVKLRLNVQNADGLLKPDMFVRAVIRTRIAGGGRVFDPYLAGKWISPMHPWVVKKGPGSCDVCGMDLVPARDLGFVARESELEPPLVIPASAPLITGTRAVVYVARPGADRPTYEGREVRLGPRAGDVYVVREGLAEGEQVVVEGNFKIDSSMQIQARPSMMSPEGRAPPQGHDHGAAPSTPVPGATSGERPRHEGHGAPAGGDPARLSSLFGAYLRVQTALAADDLQEARKAFREAEAALHEVPDSILLAEGSGGAPLRPALHAALVSGGNGADLAAARQSFRGLSESLIALARSRGHALPGGMIVAFCPMVEGGGAAWLQRPGPLANPFFGASMLRCGEVRETLDPAPAGR